MPVKGTYLAIAGGGAILLWSGIKGKQWSDVLRQLIAGKPPTAATTAYTITGTSASAAAAANAAFAGGGTGGATATVGGGPGAANLAGNLQGHLGHCYVFGGAPGFNGRGCWDCSSACNYVANIESGLPIPGVAPGKYNASQHGPSTIAWLGWAPFHLQKISRGSVQRNDLCIWQTHMGIATDNANYVSAAGAGVVGRGHEDTIIQSIDNGGPSFEIPTFWRYK